MAFVSFNPADFIGFESNPSNEQNPFLNPVSPELQPNINSLPIHESIVRRLDEFILKNKIPHIIFHGPSGSGKQTLVREFIQRIYEGDKIKIKTHVMTVNCSHGKGIQFIREELKFFAKANAQTKSNIDGGKSSEFKVITLLNAHHLTVDAQSALRRCIELFSYNTRFFIVVENKDKLLNPILSRFCDIFVPEPNIIENGPTINLHQYVLSQQFKQGNQGSLRNPPFNLDKDASLRNPPFNLTPDSLLNPPFNLTPDSLRTPPFNLDKDASLRNPPFNLTPDSLLNPPFNLTPDSLRTPPFNLDKDPSLRNPPFNLDKDSSRLTPPFNKPPFSPIFPDNFNVSSLTSLFKHIDHLYESGVSCLDLMAHVKTQRDKWSEAEYYSAVMRFYQIKPQFRCEKLLMIFMINYLYREKK